MTPQHTLGDLQLAIMRVLWAAGEASVADVTRSLPPEKSRALTTIATMLTKMEKKGVVAHRSEGRQYLYRPLVSEGEVKRSMLQELAQRLFEGDYAELVSYLVDERELDARELDALKDRVAEREAELEADRAARRRGGRSR